MGRRHPSAVVRTFRTVTAGGNANSFFSFFSLVSPILGLAAGALIAYAVVVTSICFCQARRRRRTVRVVAADQRSGFGAGAKFGDFKEKTERNWGCISWHSVPVVCFFFV
jgi:hypothetical protein